MPKYIVFFSYTPQAWARMIEQPGDRTAAVRASAEAVGARLEGLYWMLGEHDGLVLVDAPDSETAAALSITSSSSGAVARLETHQLFDQDQLHAVLGKAGGARAVYRPPGEG